MEPIVSWRAFKAKRECYDLLLTTFGGLKENRMVMEKEKLLWMYRTMVRQREFEDRVAKGFAEGKIPGFVHLSQGQEATAAGPMAALRSDDYITSYHRGHGHLIAKGGSPERMLAELYGKATGCCSRLALA